MTNIVEAEEKRPIAVAVDDDKVAGTLLGQHRGVAGVKEAALEFVKIRDYTTFDAEWTLNGEDLVFHFFTPSDSRVTEHYWLDVFAKALDKVAQKHFDATAPRLTAKYTEEVRSWWFKARGYSHILDKDAFMAKFFGLLDDELDANFQAMSQPKT